ncbi:MAG: phosphate signaling complex protein PhoU [Anaerolineae bacterium]|nr:phosphate signaling complex protein PhoU [Anaerolineae bacterium]
MPRDIYQFELNALSDRIIALGSRVEFALLDSVDALKNRNFDANHKIINQDKFIDEERYAIEADTLTLIATQAPMASDLRRLAAVLEIVGELERIGDYAKGISNISLMIGNTPFIKPLVDIPLMAKIAADMLHRSLEAFVNMDVEKAASIPEEDDRVDAMYNQIYRELMTYVIANPKLIEQVNLLLWTAHNLERAADRVTNICERVLFTVTGNMVSVGSENEGIESF